MPADTMTTTDLEVLHQLNRDYITSVQTSDVKRFDEILADDFLCSNPDGSLVDRAGFLAQIARPAGVKNLECRDVKIRAMGDVAHVRRKQTRRILVYGAGATGQMLVREMRANQTWNMRPVGFVDDDPSHASRARRRKASARPCAPRCRCSALCPACRRPSGSAWWRG